MKTKIRKIILAVSGALALSASAHAATLSGSGCNVSGPVSFAYINAGTSLLIIGGGACFVSDITAGEQAALASFASESETSGKSITVGTGASLGGGAPNGLSVVMQ